MKQHACSIAASRWLHTCALEVSVPMKAACWSSRGCLATVHDSYHAQLGDPDSHKSIISAIYGYNCMSKHLHKYEQ
jgi:hypothetical protein